jgi:ribosomal protein S18 acetylase RimI-like enzyme
MSTTSSAASSDILDPLLEFCAAHPVPDTDAPRLLTRLNTGPGAVIDWRERGLVAVLLDAIIGTNKVVPFEVVGLAGGAIATDLAADLLAELARRAKALGAACNEIALTPIWASHRPLLEAAGYRHSYTDCDMVCRDPAWGDDLPLPPESFWTDVTPDWVDEYIRVLQSGFADVPGAFVPAPDEIRRYLAQSGIKARILVERGRGIGLLRYTEPNSYINAVARDGSVRGRGLGRLIMDEARRCLVARGNHRAPMRLTVVNTNTAAIELYRRCHFEIEKEVAVLIRHFA